MIRTTALAVLLAASFSAYAGEEAKAKADPEKGKATAETVCAACHNADGNSMIPANPILAGQHKEYLFKQLANFKAAGDKPAVRQNGVMNGMVAALTEEDMRNVAAWFSQQKMKPTQAKNAETIKLGEKLWRGGNLAKGIPACAGCHGPAGAGLPAQYPRLAGQHAEYTEAQLKAFRVGERANDPEKMMRMIADKMSDAEIRAVADYAAGLRSVK